MQHAETAEWDLQHTRWFHAVNTPSLLADAIGTIDALAAGQPSLSIPVFGIEADIRLSPHGVLPTPQPVMQHDAFRQSDLSSDLPLFTLWDFFSQLTSTSTWFLGRKESGERAARSTTPCRLIVKLDFKAPAAARLFTEHVATRAPGGFAELCSTLAPPSEVNRTPELMIWWNADVCPSDSFTAVEKTGTLKPEASELNQRFTDLPAEEVVDLVAETIKAFGHCAAEVLGISIGWVLAPPSPPPTPGHVPSVSPLTFPYYTQKDGDRMQRFVSALFATTTPESNPIRLLTFPVLYEAIFPSQSVLASLGVPLPVGAAPPVNHVAIDALQRLLRHSVPLGFPCSRAAATGAVDSADCFVTFWKMVRAPADSEESRADLARAAGVFPSSTVDGEL